MAGEKTAENFVVEKAGSMPPIASPEKLPQPEMQPERIPVSAEKPAETVKPQEKAGAPRSTTALPSAVVSFQDRRAQAIDAILAEGLNEVFLKMTPAEQKEFKAKGEETVTKINKLLDQAKIKTRKIIDLIRRWLKIIPGVNKFFLEQEAKIKADRIIKIKDKF